jgi:hypothetical protein
MALLGTSVDHAVSGGRTVSVTLPKLGLRKATRLVVPLLILIALVGTLVGVRVQESRLRDHLVQDQVVIVSQLSRSGLAVLTVEPVTVKVAKSRFVSERGNQPKEEQFFENFDNLNRDNNVRYYVVWLSNDNGNGLKMTVAVVDGPNGDRARAW